MPPDVRRCRSDVGRARCDGALPNGAPLPEPGYTDGDAGAGEHEYFVTVVYDRGESCPSNVVTTGTAGLAVGSASPDVFCLSASDGEIVVSGAEGRHVTVSTLAGRLVYSGAGTASMRLRVGSGVYIVRIGAAVMKIIVR